MISERVFVFLTGLFLLCSCSSDNESITNDEALMNEEESAIDENTSVNEDIVLSASDIQLNVTEGEVLLGQIITISIPSDVELSMFKVYFNDTLIREIKEAPFEFSIEVSEYRDGAHNIKIEALFNASIIGSKNITVKIDNNGPTIDFDGFGQGQSYCGPIQFISTVTDEVSEIEKVTVFWGEQIIEEIEKTSNLNFTVNPNELDLGENYLKVVMEDEVGNISQDSTLLSLTQKVLKLELPDDFVGSNSTLTVILSDTKGEYLSSTAHDSNSNEILELCSESYIGDEDEFMLTFVLEFDSLNPTFYIYQNLKRVHFKEIFKLGKRILARETKFIDTEITQYEEDIFIRASTNWSSITNFTGNFSFLDGHFSKQLNLNGLNHSNSFIFAYDVFNPLNYRWRFIEDLYLVSSLSLQDFSNDIEVKTFSLSGNPSNPLIAIYGYESELDYEHNNSHLLYNNRLPFVSGHNYEYPVPNIEQIMTYSVQSSNYTISGNGNIPSQIYIPNSGMSFTKLNGDYVYYGVDDFEVGRAWLRNRDSEFINVHLLFNGLWQGGLTQPIVLPKIPSELFSQEITQIFDSQDFEYVQGVAENYEGITNYDQFLEQIFIPSVPFFTVVESRERFFEKGPGFEGDLLIMKDFPISGFLR